MALLALLLLPSLVGCVTPSARRRHGREIQKVLDQGLMLLGDSKVRVNRKPFRNDCSGFVSACYSTLDLDLIDPLVESASGTEMIFQTLKKQKKAIRSRKARTGDLAFFHNTHDRNDNGLRDDRFTHIAIVEKVEKDGTIQYLHYASGKVKRGVLNIRHRSTARDPDTGKLWNSHLRAGGGRVLAGQLLFRFGRPHPLAGS